MTNLSTIPKYEKGTLVKYVFGSSVGEVIAHRNNALIEVQCLVDFGGKEPIWLDEKNLRLLTWREFAWFRLPSGQWMSGKTRGYMAIVIHLFTGLLFFGSIAQDANWWSTFALIPVIGYWIGTRMNFTKRWV